MKFSVFIEPLDDATTKRSGIQLDLRDAKNGFVELFLRIPAASKAKPIERSLGMVHLRELEAAVSAVRVLMGGLAT
ncbi:MAG: hypothetical protein ABMA13_23040 [Chthoniobacteraceae bacterium]